MNIVRVKQIIKEELRKVLKEADLHRAEKEFHADDPKRDYPRGGDDEGDRGGGSGSQKEYEHSLRYGLDFPESSSRHGHDFKEDVRNRGETWIDGRAKVLGNELAYIPKDDGKHLAKAAKAYWEKNKKKIKEDEGVE